MIAGRNGVGKSTLLRCLAGVLLPDAGTIVRGRKKRRRKKIGFISDRLSLFEDWTIGAGRSPSTAGSSRSPSSTIACCGAWSSSQKDKISNLSAGERAILHLSLVLSQKPSLLLVDEVLHMLDPYIRDLFIEALIETMAVRQAAVLTVNHTFSEIERLPERVLVMERGPVRHRRNPGSAARQDEKSRQPRPAARRPALLFQQGRGANTRNISSIRFSEELRTAHALDFQDIALPEIIKAFIGGGYEQKRMA